MALTTEELLEYEWIVKSMIKQFSIGKDYEEFYNLGLFWVFKGLTSYDGTRGANLATHLFNQVRYGFLTEFNKRKRIKEIPSDDEIYPPLMESKARDDFLSLEWKLDLEKLDPTLTQAIQLTLEGYTHQEIGQRLFPDVPDKGQSQYMHHYFKRERQRLKEVFKTD